MAGAARRRWGWHRLDARWAEQLVTDSAIGRGDLVLDIGAGLGAITAPLLATGARVIAIEANGDRVARLRARFSGDLVVVQADAADLRVPRRRFHVVANPPFGVTTALLRRLLQPGSRLESACLVLQEQAARRWASPRAPAAARWRQTFDTTLGRPIPRTAFHPPPAVNSCTLMIRRR